MVDSRIQPDVAIAARRRRKTYIVRGDTGSDANRGLNMDQPLATIQAALDKAVSLDQVVIMPKANDEPYQENLSILRTKPNVKLIGLGDFGDVAIEALANGVALTCHADGVGIENIDLAGNGTGGAAVVTGKRFRAHRSKLEGGSKILTIGPRKVSEEATKGNGSDSLFTECEFAWGDSKGVVLQGSDFGATTENVFRDCSFHDIQDAHFEEGFTAGAGDAQHQFLGLVIDRCLFQEDEEGVDPTKYVSLNDDNANKGIVTRCVFPTALDGGRNLVSTGVKWVANHHPAGLSTGQPS